MASGASWFKTQAEQIRTPYTARNRNPDLHGPFQPVVIQQGMADLGDRKPKDQFGKTAPTSFAAHNRFCHGISQS